MANELAPLQQLLNSVLSRIEALETKVGIEGPVSVPSSGIEEEEETQDHPAVVAYDEHIKTALEPFSGSIDDLEGLSDIGALMREAWAGIRVIVVFASKCKKPANVTGTITPLLKQTQEAVKKISGKRMDRKWDWHQKAMMEMLGCLSWVLVVAPPAPASFVKELVGSSDFWCNKIRKEYKGKDDKQIAFCDNLKKLLLDLSAYLKEYHLSGLFWNPRGKDASEIKPENDPPATQEKKEPEPPKAPPAAPMGGGIAALKDELTKKRTTDGDSAATGLKKVTRDQQTWRKEYTKDEGAPVPAAKPKAAPTAPKKTTVKGPPICQYQDRGNKWVIENQTKESNPDGVCAVTITDPKQQAYIYACEGATIKLEGKIKSLIMDSCKKCAVVFESAISSCELVNCKSVQVQTTGICPSFAIDKTDGCVIYLSKETISVSKFVTSKSSEMNVNYPGDDGEMKESPIPEQFAHKLVGGAITSEVSDIYH